MDLHLDTATDVQLWEHSCGAGVILISKDEDFVFLANRTGDTGRLLWVRLGNCRNAVLLAAFQTFHDQIVLGFGAGQRIIELR
jgi:predicted nuclease of predicted toxin-antitoxin system